MLLVFTTAAAKDIVFIMPNIPIGQTDTNEAVFLIPMIEASLGPKAIDLPNCAAQFAVHLSSVYGIFILKQESTISNI
ncbi:hypothetical protein AYI98_07595 [Shewanella algae]|nr:hypothetical protein AYI98_07595 [Shewanella algae]